jgi:hypothetical protein
MFLYVLLTKQQQQISKSFKIPPIILHQVLEIKTDLLVGLYEKVIFCRHGRIPAEKKSWVFIQIYCFSYFVENSH